MKYYKNIINGYITSISTGAGQIEITKQEYNEILNVIYDMPTAPQGYGYKLKSDLTWKLYEITEQDYDEIDKAVN